MFPKRIFKDQKTADHVVDHHDDNALSLAGPEIDLPENGLRENNSHIGEEFRAPEQDRMSADLSLYAKARQ
ncbi:hypothetical protein DSECCO2_480630 [anaerobic digester metagenome]